MKKHLIAAAVAAAVAVPAMAQVSIYGAYGNGVTSTETNGGTAVQTMGGAQLGTPVLGFQGTEDLGQGMKAFFKLEGTLGANGSLGFTNPSGGGSNIFDRQAHVGLSGGFGTITLGRQNDPMKDIEGLASMTNLIDGTNVTTVGDRYANVTKYTSPSIGGFNVSYAYSDSAVGSSGSDAGSTSSTIPVSAALDGIKLRSLNAQYAVGGVKVAAAHAEATTTAAVQTSSTRFTAQGTLGIATLGFAYTENDTDNTNTRDQWLVAAKLALGSGLNVYGSVASNDSTSGTTNGDAITVMLTKDLSKRTTAYVGYSDTDMDTAANDVKVSTVGIIHKF